MRHLVIDPDTMLPLSVPMQRFQTIAWQSSQVCQAGGTVQDVQASLGLRLHSLEAAYPLTVVEGFGVLVTKALDHGRRIAECYVSRKGGHAIATAPHAGFERQRDTGAIRLAFFTPIQLSDSIERALMYEAANGRELTLTYTGGSQKLLVPEGVPIVMSVPADRSLLKPGEYVSVTANVGADGKMTAQRIQVSQDGVKPPQ